MKRILGVDWGRRWIGVALSDPGQIIASPAGKIEARSGEEALRKVAEAAKENDVEAVVVGIPFNMDGSLGETGKAAGDFSEQIAERTGLPVHRWDERLTSLQAERALRSGGFSRKKRKSRRDSVAAQIILQSFLDSRSGEDGTS
jgi:putative Holliday junction resolvase